MINLGHITALLQYASGSVVMDRKYPRLIQQKLNCTLMEALLQSISEAHYFKQSATRPNNRLKGIRIILFDSTNMKVSSFVPRFFLN